MNKKYVAFITIVLIAHLTNAEQDKPTDDSNYSKKRIEEDYGPSLPLFLDSTQRGIGTSPIVIEDNEKTDHVKVIVRGVKSNRSLTEEKDNDTTFVFKTGSETVRVVYNEQIRLLSVDTFKEQVGVVKEKEEQEDQVATLYYGGIQESSLRLRSAINPDQRKICYDKEKQELTITIPKIIEQNKGIDGDGE
ncbi:MAG TPA: hypothetical protein ENI08_01400 [Candidatus Dependentiae bacterium]|nr:hypothetical protein [Candidatus Dependentiae bacterium]